MSNYNLKSPGVYFTLEKFKAKKPKPKLDKIINLVFLSNNKMGSCNSRDYISDSEGHMIGLGSFKDNIQSNTNITQMIKKRLIESFNENLQSNTNIKRFIIKRTIESFNENLQSNINITQIIKKRIIESYKENIK